MLGANDIAINFVSDELLRQNCGIIFVIDGYSFAIMLYKGKDFIIDFHSTDMNGINIPYDSESYSNEIWKSKKLFAARMK